MTFDKMIRVDAVLVKTLPRSSSKVKVHRRKIKLLLSDQCDLEHSVRFLIIVGVHMASTERAGVILVFYTITKVGERLRSLKACRGLISGRGARA